MSVSGQATQFIYNGDGNLVKKVKPDNDRLFTFDYGREKQLRSGQALVESTKWTKLLAEV